MNNEKGDKAMDQEKLEEMKQMIQDEIQSIGNLKERVVFKELMEGVFLSLYETNLQMYERLEKRIMDDLAYDINRYLIQTGIVEREYFDPSHHLMAAMRKEDEEEREYKISEICEAIEKEGEYCLSTVFFQCDVLELEKILQKNQSYSCILYGENEQEVTIKLQRNQSYRNEIEQIYHLFMKNGIPWKTLNAPYVFKMVDLILTEIPKELKGEKIERFQVSFGELEPYIHTNMIPVWNVRHLLLDSIGFPVACEDHESYEHTIYIGDYGAENAYLVEEKAGIRNVRQNKDSLVVTGMIPNAKKWNITMIQKGEKRKIDRYQYPIMENLRKDGFSERFHKRVGQPIKTYAEIERFVLGFGLEDYLQYQGCKLEENIEQETYSMNFFMVDEIRQFEGTHFLTLYFKPVGKETWLLRDIASFIASELQAFYPEYRCGGKLV